MNYGDPLDPTNDFIDKQDLEVRAAELRDRSDLWNSGYHSDEEIEAEQDTEAYDAGPLDRLEDSELFEIEQVLDEMGTYVDGPLIRKDYFPTYARQFAEDINGDIYDSWPQSSIDWTEAAEDLEMDYTEVTFGGEQWFVR